MKYYEVILLVYFGIDLLAVWGLNLELGVAGVANLGYILLVATGAYTYGVMTLVASSPVSGLGTYVGGYDLPSGIAILGAVVVSALVGGALGLIGSRRIRQDYFAITMFGAEIFAWTVVSGVPHFLNGPGGLFFIPHPVDPYGWGYVGFVAAFTLPAYFILRRFTTGPMGRTLRAMRDDPLAAVRVGKDIVRLRIVVQIVGGAFAGLSGALLAAFLGSWSPSAWTPFETLLFLTAVLVGGMGNDAGAVLGTAVVPILIVQGSQFLPSFPGHPELTQYASIILFSAVTLAFMFFRPKGLVPERRPQYDAGTVAQRHPFQLRDLLDPVTLPSISAQRGAAVRAIGDISRVRESRGPIVVLEGLERHFGGVRAVDGVDLEIPAGGITGLIGPNGAGKSTLLALLVGTLQPAAGTITIGGENVTAMPTHRRARHGIVATSQLPHEFRRLTTIENLVVAATRQKGESLGGVIFGKYFWRAQEAAFLSRAQGLLAVFDMEGKASEFAQNLSGGQKRLLEVMRALMTKPRVLLLDEPFAGLSPLMSDRLIDVCRELATEGMTIVVVEHDLTIVEELCEHVVVMARGTVLAQGTMEEMRKAPDVQSAYVSG